LCPGAAGVAAGVPVPDGGGIGRVVIVPERSEWDTVRRRCNHREGLLRESCDPHPARAEPPRSQAEWVPPKWGKGKLRVWMKQETINATHESRARHLPPWGEAGGGSSLPSVLDRAFRKYFDEK